MTDNVHHISAAAGTPESMVLSRVGNATHLCATLVAKSDATLESEAACLMDQALSYGRRAMAEDEPDLQREMFLSLAGEYAWRARLHRAALIGRRSPQPKRVGFV